MPDRALVVVTRVAAGRRTMVPEAARLADGLTDPTEEWVAAREDLLERACAPSLRRLSVPFTWVWRSVPQRREQVEEIAARVFPEAVVLDDEQTSDAVAPDAENFLTARVDSDDALGAEALEAALALDLAPDTLVNWWEGWQLNWETGQIAPRCWPRRRQGPFLAVTHESRERFLDTGGEAHEQARRGRHVLTIEGRSWVQVIHGDNLMNRWLAHGEEPLVHGRAASRVRESFGIVW